MMEIIKYKNKKYPYYQSIGNASQFAIPYAKHVCIGEGYDIGCMKKEWAFPGSIPIDLSFEDEYHANNLPKKVDYIFSSHCLEHIPNWVETLDYWYSTIIKGGILFLYLPDYSQEYWRPWNNKKHLSIFTPEIIRDYMIDRGYENIFISGVDLNNSFMIFGEKK
jgi:hypothetical protein